MICCTYTAAIPLLTICISHCWEWIAQRCQIYVIQFIIWASYYWVMVHSSNIAHSTCYFIVHVFSARTSVRILFSHPLAFCTQVWSHFYPHLHSPDCSCYCPIIHSQRDVAHSCGRITACIPASTIARFSDRIIAHLSLACMLAAGNKVASDAISHG